MDGGAHHLPNLSDSQPPTVSEQKRAAALQFAIQSFHGQEVTDDGLIKRARRIADYFQTGA